MALVANLITAKEVKEKYLTIIILVYLQIKAYSQHYSDLEGMMKNIVGFPYMNLL